MDWKQLIFQLILELGGFTTITLSCLKYVGKTFEYKISKQYEAKLNEKLELYKKSIENMSYVKKVKFDANFTVCCEISEKISYCFDAIKTITPLEGYGIDQSMEIKDINENINDLKKCIFRYMPVLSRELYNDLIDLLHLFNNQVQAYQALLSDREIEDIDLISQNELKLKQEEACVLLRQYYDNLGVSLN